MNKCICDSCENLKSVISEKPNAKNEINEECEFGFPSDDCLACEVDGCELTCENYKEVKDDKEDEKIVILKCKTCGKEVKHVTTNDDVETEVFCVTCYFNQ